MYSSGYSVQMATMFVQQSQEYIQQIEEEIERLQQLVNQVRAMIHSEEELESAEPERPAPRKYVKKSAAKKAGSDAAPKKIGRPKKVVEAAEA